MRPTLALLALLGLACSGSTPLAKFVVTSQDANEGCSTLLDYCRRVTCTIKNEGMVPGQAVVDIELLDDADAVVNTQTQRVELGPGDTKTVSHDFTDAKLFGKEQKYRCAVR